MPNGTVRFRFDIKIDNPEYLEEILERTKDFTPVFETIIDRWARNNQEKFERSVGMEASGATVDDSGVFWEGLAESTMKQKRRRSRPDQIMVDTGELRQALTDPEGFFRETTLTKALWGMPKSLDDEIKVRYNWDKRQTIFIGYADQNAIKKEVTDYLGLGGDWKSIMFAKGWSMAIAKQESAEMDMAFNETVGA